MNLRANDDGVPPAPLVLTAMLDATTQSLFNALREAYFPPERNWLDAHLTLFHALPGAFEPAIIDECAACARGKAPLPFAARGPYSLGAGVAIALDCPLLLSWRESLRDALLALPGFALTAQDRAKRRLHVTVQNKVTPQDAKRTLQGLEMAWNPGLRGEVRGLQLWRYQGGPWQPVQTFIFDTAKEVG